MDLSKNSRKNSYSKIYPIAKIPNQPSNLNKSLLKNLALEKRDLKFTTKSTAKQINYIE
jgi:hypothetical protein